LIYRSYIGPEAILVDYIDWVQLIREKHEALLARRNGDAEPWRRYVTERENTPYDTNDIPLAGQIIVVRGQRKNREGLPAPKLRLAALDRQQGDKSKGEFPYWWLVIRDYKIDKDKIRSLLVYEGRLETDEQVISILKDHQVAMWQVVADSGDDTTHVYLFCMQHGINAIKGGREEFYAHTDGARRIFSSERPLHSMLNRPPKFPYLEAAIGVLVPHPQEPLFWLYSKAGIRERLNWLRLNTKFDTPEDVSEDYLAHMESEERVIRRHPRTNEEIHEWVQLKDRNDLFVCEAYIAMQIEMAGWIGIEFEKKKEQNANITPTIPSSD
jgi:hypothetical protein